MVDDHEYLNHPSWLKNSGYISASYKMISLNFVSREFAKQKQFITSLTTEFVKLLCKLFENQKRLTA